MDTIGRLQRWYAAHCDGDWEHAYGVRVDTLDNPGWSVTIDLIDTSLEDKAFETVERGLDTEPSADWLKVWVEGGRAFRGVGDPSKLDVILQTFLDWAER